MAARRKPKPPRDWPVRFLADFARTGNVTRSARKAGVTRQGVYDRREADPDFAKAMDVAIEEAMDELEHEARRRAVTGTLKPVFYKGSVCGRVREYSDGLLTLLLKAGRPDRFRENAKVEHTGQVGIVPVREVVIPRPEAGEDADDD